MDEDFKHQIKLDVAEVLAILSSYAQQEILDIVDYSEDTEFQLSAMIPAGHKDLLSAKLKEYFDWINQQDLFKNLFTSIKTVEKIIDYIIKNHPDYEEEL